MNKNNQSTIRIAALADIHVKEASKGVYNELFAKISDTADILALCGDLTDLGLISEAQNLVTDLSSLRIPVVVVLGNHDYESNKQEEVKNILIDHGVHVLHGTEYIFEKYGKKIGFTGVKGFGGGFNPYMWGRFGETEQKAFYDAIASEVQQLEIGINKLQSLDLAATFVLLHFAPIRQTVEGDIIEMYPFLGSSRLEEVINRYQITAVLHGHSHHGTHRGKTMNGTEVYNVALPLMQKLNPQQPFAIIEV